MSSDNSAVSSAAWDIAAKDYGVNAGSAQPSSNGGKEGPVALAQDDVPDTHWHTLWGDKNLNNAWYEFDLKNPTTVNGLRYLPRQSGSNGKLSEVRIELTKADGTLVNQTGTFGTSGWQKISFEPVSDVTKVRMVAVHTLGDTADKFASAAELRITTPELQIEHSPLTGDVDTLKMTVARAAALNAKDYTTTSWKAFAAALKAAQDALASTADPYTVLLAQTNLDNAMNQLKSTKQPGGGSGSGGTSPGSDPYLPGGGSPSGTTGQTPGGDGQTPGGSGQTPGTSPGNNAGWGGNAPANPQTPGMYLPNGNNKNPYRIAGLAETGAAVNEVFVLMAGLICVGGLLMGRSWYLGKISRRGRLK